MTDADLDAALGLDPINHLAWSTKSEPTPPGPWYRGTRGALFEVVYRTFPMHTYDLDDGVVRSAQAKIGSSTVGFIEKDTLPPSAEVHLFGVQEKFVGNRAQAATVFLGFLQYLSETRHPTWRLHAKWRKYLRRHVRGPR